MQHSLLASTLLTLALGSGALHGQGWDPVKQASGWSRVDRDGSYTFFEPASRTLQTWMKDTTGASGLLELGKLGLTPEKWVLDSANNAWIVSGTTLQQVDKNGKPGKQESLPAEVADLAWDKSSNFVLSYRTQAPYLEKRDKRTGALLWSYGAKPRREDATPKALHRIAVNEDGNVVLASGTSLSLTLVEGAKGKALGQSVFTFNDAAPPDLSLGDGERGPLGWWLGHGVAFSAVSGAQIPAAAMQGLLLARMDLAKGSVEFLPTGVTDDHAFLGVTESEAVLLSPKGGLVFVSIR